MSLDQAVWDHKTFYCYAEQCLKCDGAKGRCKCVCHELDLLD